MMNDDLEQLLGNLKLRQLQQILDRELERAEKEQPSYPDFLTRLLREEYQTQQMRFLEYRIRRARLPERWALQTFPWDQQPGVSRTMVEQLAELDFIDRAANLVFIGPTGWARPDWPLPSCSERCRPATAVYSSRLKTSSTTCTVASPIIPHDDCSTGSLGSISYRSTKWDISTCGPSRATSSSS